MENIGTILGWISFGLLGIWRIYWFISEKKAEQHKPKTQERINLFSRKGMSKVVTLAAFGVVGVQLLGVKIFTFPQENLLWQIVGFVMVVVGLGIAVIGRHDLGVNWANCYEYQVKKDQQLVTQGIYRFIRHPLYAGIALFLIGSQLVVQSYLVGVYLLAFSAANKQAQWEENLLINHFGNKYREYMKRTKRFIPFLW